jgi:hypothetical protein
VDVDLADLVPEQLGDGAVVAEPDPLPPHLERPPQAEDAVGDHRHAHEDEAPADEHVGGVFLALGQVFGQRLGAAEHAAAGQAQHDGHDDEHDRLERGAVAGQRLAERVPAAVIGVRAWLLLFLLRHVPPPRGIYGTIDHALRPSLAGGPDVASEKGIRVTAPASWLHQHSRVPDIPARSVVPQRGRTRPGFSERLVSPGASRYAAKGTVIGR